MREYAAAEWLRPRPTLLVEKASVRVPAPLSAAAVRSAARAALLNTSAIATAPALVM